MSGALQINVINFLAPRSLEVKPQSLVLYINYIIFYLYVLKLKNWTLENFLLRLVIILVDIKKCLDFFFSLEKSQMKANIFFIIFNFSCPGNGI